MKDNDRINDLEASRPIWVARDKPIAATRPRHSEPQSAQGGGMTPIETN